MKYELTDETRIINGATLHRIRCIVNLTIYIRYGHLGGFIESERNLSQNGDCWIHPGACVYGSALVCDSARIFGLAEVYGNANVYGSACVYGSAKVYDDARVGGLTMVFGDADVCGSAHLFNDEHVCGHAYVCDWTVVSGLNGEIITAQPNKFKFKSCGVEFSL